MRIAKTLIRLGRCPGWLSLRWAHNHTIDFAVSRLKFWCQQTNLGNYARTWQNQQNDLCAQRKLRSTWAPTKSNQSLLSAWRKLGCLAVHEVHSKDWCPGCADAQAEPNQVILLVLLCSSSITWARSQENLSSGFATSYHSNRPTQLMRLAKIWKFWL